MILESLSRLKMEDEDDCVYVFGDTASHHFIFSEEANEDYKFIHEATKISVLFLSRVIVTSL